MSSLSIWAGIGIVGVVLAILVTAVALGRRRRLAEAFGDLVSSEAGYRSLFEHSADGLYRTSPDGRILRANSSFARLLGFDSAEALAASGLNVGSGIYVIEQRRREFIEAVTAADRVDDFESQILRRDGTVIWVSESARAIRDADGTLVCFEGRMTDITQRRRGRACRWRGGRRGRAAPRPAGAA
jgi:PAS domain S-box-containing protein